MIKDIIENNEYKSLVEKQIKENVLFLLEKKQEFSITANIQPISFTPELPKVIKDQMHKQVLEMRILEVWLKYHFMQSFK